MWLIRLGGRKSELFKLWRIFFYFFPNSFPLWRKVQQTMGVCGYTSIGTRAPPWECRGGGDGEREGDMGFFLLSALYSL